MKVGILSCAVMVFAAPAPLFASGPAHLVPDEAPVANAGGGASLPAIGLHCPEVITSTRIETLLVGDDLAHGQIAGTINRFLASADIDQSLRAPAPLKSLDGNAQSLGVSINASWCGQPDAAGTAAAGSPGPAPAPSFDTRHWTKVTLASCVARGEETVREEWTFARRIGEPWKLGKYDGRLEKDPCPKKPT